MKTPFAKYHALGNDFIVVDLRSRSLPGPQRANLARAICDRRTGVGADGVLYLSNSRKADVAVRIVNADGSEAEKSGNGLRIVGLHVVRTSKTKLRTLDIETPVSIDRVSFRRGTKGRAVLSASVGRPDFDTRTIPVRTRVPQMVNAPLRVGDVDLPVTCLSVGNPHCVVIVADFEFDWHQIGREIEQHKLFPNRTNVEFARFVSRKELRVKEWERGVGPTQSSGTGAAAAVAAGVMLGIVDRDCQVEFDGGCLEVNWRSDSDDILLTGPVTFVAEGMFGL